MVLVGSIINDDEPAPALSFLGILFIYDVLVPWLLSISERVLENSERNSDISDLLSLKLDAVDRISFSTLDLNINKR